MHEIEQRLIQCFSVVFPELSHEEIVSASPAGTGNWDSMSAVTLLAVVQEEFGIDLEAGDIESFASFERILERVNEAIRSKAESPAAAQATA